MDDPVAGVDDIVREMQDSEGAHIERLVSTRYPAAFTH
jgi:hypothetical protein